MTGLKSFEFMDQFIKAGDNRALLIDLVLAQASNFLRDWSAYLTAYKEVASHGRILNIPGILTNSSNPDLYLASMTWCQFTGRIGKSNNFKMSNIITVASASDKKEEAVKKLGGKSS